MNTVEIFREPDYINEKKATGSLPNAFAHKHALFGRLFEICPIDRTVPNIRFEIFN